MTVDAAECRVEDLEAAIAGARLIEPRLASASIGEVPVYDGGTMLTLDREAVADEIASVLLDGAGLLVIRSAFDLDVVDAASEVFRAIIDEQRLAGDAAGDHYAEPGANDRVWNALEKLAVRAPEVFVDYYGNELLHLVPGAWFGPGAKFSSQVNVVNPGGQAQQPHRDYPMGFLTQDEAGAYPLHVHRLAPQLTLQAGIAHTDMPVETGPTMVLPGSQRYPLGYLAWRLEPIKAYFAANMIQPELDRGDLLFFNPAVLHGAGTNHTTDVRRMANLLQISSPFGLTLEAIDRDRMIRALYPAMVAQGPSPAIDRAIAAAADTTPFPFNLDRDQPIDGLAPPSMAAIVEAAVAEGRAPLELAELLDEYERRRRTH